MNAPASRSPWPLLLAASAILMITMGARQTTGLFIAPIQASTGVGIAEVSLALAIGQFVWGAVQPLFGAIADRHGPLRVLQAGGLLLAVGLAMTPLLPTQWGLMLTLGVLTAAGAGAGSFAILIGATASRMPAEKRSFAAGFINAGGSFGQFLFAPLVQLVIGVAGWTTAMFGLAAASLLTLPLAWPLRRRTEATASTSDAAIAATESVPPTTGITLRQQLRIALRDRSYWFLHIGFLTCGVHIAFLVTHLPGEIALCGLSPNVSAVSIALIGLFNIAGSLAAGALGQRYRMKHILAVMYASRAVLIGVYLVSPPTPTTFYVFAAALGFTWLATVPPTAGLVGKLFGPRYLGTLFGLTLLSHQLGGFLGAWLGGVAFARFGDYRWMWYADMALALLAALINLPIREASPRSQTAQPAAP